MSPLSTTLSHHLCFDRFTGRFASEIDRSEVGLRLTADWIICQPHLGVGFELRAHDSIKHQYPDEDNQQSHPELVDEGVEPVVRVCDRIYGYTSIIGNENTLKYDDTKEGFPSGEQGLSFHPLLSEISVVRNDGASCL